MKSTRVVLVIASLLFLALGVLFSQFGPILSELARRTSTTLAEVGALFTALYIGSLLTQSVAGPISDRAGERPVLLVGLCVAAVGMLGIASSRSLLMLLPCAFVSGLGYGFLTVSTNLLVARVFVRRSVAALNLTNVFFGVGAVAGPALASLCLRAWGTSLPAIWMGVALLVILIPAVYLSPAGARRPHAGHAAGRAPAGAESAAALYRSPLLWTLSAVLALYVGLEASLGGWTATYLQATAAMRLDLAALVVSGYWLALTAGRLVNSWLGIHLTADRVLLLSLAGAVIGGCVLALSTGMTAVSIGAVLVIGFSFGAVFPTGLAIVTGAFAPHAGRATSVAQASGSAGGMTIPWLIGLVLTRVAPAAAMTCMAAGIIAMLLCYLWARRLAARASSAYHAGPSPEIR